jgi:hypothetical protein
VSRAAVLLAAAAIVGPPLAAQAPTATSGDSTTPGDSARIVGAVLIEREGVFDRTEETSWWARAGNALHITTRRRVVEREILFRGGEPFDSARVAETARNLRALGVFRRVLIDSMRTDSGLVLRVTTKDGWSIRPTIDFANVGSQTAWALGLEELNLLGNAAFGSLTYSNHPDRTSLTAVFRQPRLFAGKVYLQIGVQDRSDGRSLSFGMGQPFLSLASRSGASAAAVDFDGDVLRFFEGERSASVVLRRRYALLRADAARAVLASSRGFVRVGVLGQLRRDDFVDRDVIDSVPFPRTLTGAIGPYVWLNRASFTVVRNFRSFLREEDIDLSEGLLLGTYLAPSAFGYDRDGLGLQASALAGTRLPGGFATVRAQATGLVSGEGLDSGSVRLTGTWLVQPARRHSLTVFAQGGWQENAVPGEEFDLGLGRGPRAFYAHAFTGDRMINLTAEYRFTAVEDLWNVIGVGLAGFVDHGGAWYSGSRRRTGTDAGIGIRLGPSRTAEGGSLSLDLARRFATDVQGAGWALVVSRVTRF